MILNHKMGNPESIILTWTFQNVCLSRIINPAQANQAPFPADQSCSCKSFLIIFLFSNWYRCEQMISQMKLHFATTLYHWTIAVHITNFTFTSTFTFTGATSSWNSNINLYCWQYLPSCSGFLSLTYLPANGGGNLEPSVPPEHTELSLIRPLPYISWT